MAATRARMARYIHLPDARSAEMGGALVIMVAQAPSAGDLAHTLHPCISCLHHGIAPLLQPRICR